METSFYDYLSVLGDPYAIVMFIQSTNERKMSFIAEENSVRKISINRLLFNHLIRKRGLFDKYPCLSTHDTTDAKCVCQNLKPSFKR